MSNHGIDNERLTIFVYDTDRRLYNLEAIVGGLSETYKGTHTELIEGLMRRVTALEQKQEQK